MTLEVIGAGFGRTGTRSLKDALETLGVGACYHMAEVFANPEHVAVWDDASRGKPVDWDALFAGYRAAVDWPACAYYRTYLERYPEARVILTVRDPERWHASVLRTIYEVSRRRAGGDGPPPTPERRRHAAMIDRLIWNGTFGGRVEDKEHAVAVFERHNEEVRRTVPPERLLVLEAGEGWEPLCAFLGVPIPDAPYPHLNSTEAFRENIGKRSENRRGEFSFDE